MGCDVGCLPVYEGCLVMQTNTEQLAFPRSGLSIVRAKKRAKELVKSGEYSTLSEAQNSIAQGEMSLPWAKAMEAIKLSKNNPIIQFMTVSDIQSVMSDIPDLTDFGLGIYRNRRKTLEERQKEFEKEREHLLKNVDECNKCCMYLQHLNKKKKQPIGTLVVMA